MTTRAKTPLPWTVPAHLTPSWRRLPRLAWIAATGVAPDLGRAQILAVAPFIPLLLPLLTAARATGQLAAHPRALVIVAHRRHAPITLAGLCLTQIILILAITSAALVIAVPPAWWTWLNSLLFTGLVIAGLQFAVTCVPTVLVSLRSHRRPALDHTPSLAPVLIPAHAIHLTCAAAWPRRHGHGARLWNDLAAAQQPTDRPVVARAATPALARRYATATTPPGIVHDRTVVWRAPGPERARGTTEHAQYGAVHESGQRPPPVAPASADP
ncbi:hypothetical protein [Kineosporia babensis]|uniref:Uncharacterized protein n=1 Tax=Kineosporia babensis TaxID=499548 RepID=A0A9X1NPE0_9ACTN|nr:hypothetical protein [Kineosporia babensis]MCD5316851.1 hypothetical protein [Kineosporia babensis]